MRPCRRCLADAVAVVGGVGHHHRGRQALDQGHGLRGVTAVAGGEDEADRAAQTSDGHVDLGAQTAAGAAERLIFRPPFFAPEAC